MALELRLGFCSGFWPGAQLFAEGQSRAVIVVLTTPGSKAPPDLEMVLGATQQIYNVLPSSSVIPPPCFYFSLWSKWVIE